MDHRDHDPPWWTRSVQDHLEPRYDISLMLYGAKETNIVHMDISYMRKVLGWN